MLPHRNIYEQQSRNTRMTRIGVGAFVLFFGLLGLWFDLGTKQLSEEAATIPAFLLPIVIGVLVYTLWSFVHTLHARVWYHVDADENVEQLQRRAQIQWGVLFTGSVVAAVYFIHVYFQALFSPRSDLFSAVTLGSTFPWGMLLFIAVGVSYAYLTYTHGARMIARAVEAHPPNEGVEEERRLLNVTEEMRLASGLTGPQVAIVEDDLPNAFAVGIHPSQSRIVVTRGLLLMLNRDELQAVVAHEMAHIRNHDVRLMTVVTALYGSVLLLADWSRTDVLTGGVLTRRRMPRVKGVTGPMMLVLGLLASVIAPLVARLLALGISRQREYMADAGAAELTRNPGALADALTKLERANRVGGRAYRSVAHLCIIDPMVNNYTDRKGFLAEWFSTHPPTQRRVLILNSLAYRYGTVGPKKKPESDAWGNPIGP